MKRVSVVLATLALSIVLASSAGAVQMLTFGTGDVTIDEETGLVTISNASGEYGGVYLNSRRLSDKLLSDIVVRFTTVNGSSVAGGAPRFSIPFNKPNTDYRRDGYVFMDAPGCGATQPLANVDVVVSTENTSCTVTGYVRTFDVNGDPVYEWFAYANWDALVLDHANWTIQSGGVPFIISDWVNYTDPNTSATYPYLVKDIVLR